MRAVVDAAKQSVRCGDSAWPFRLDVRQGCASIALAGAEFRVRPLTWQEKVRMARFATLGEAFLQSSFLDCGVAGDDRVAAEHAPILTALAAWINLPDQDTAGLPLDGDQLAKVTVDVCRSMNIGPAEIGDLPAPMVESLWRSLGQTRQSGYPERAEPAQPQFDTKIIVLPDAPPAEPQRAPTPPVALVEPAQPDAQASDGPSFSTAMARAPSTAGPVQAAASASANSPSEPECQPSPQDLGARRQHRSRFRASLRTVAPERRGPSRVGQIGADRRTPAGPPTLSKAAATVPPLVIADSGRPLSQEMGPSAPGLLLPPAPLAEAFTLPPTVSRPSDASRLTPGAAGPKEDGALPTVASAVRPTPAESAIEPLLDEFCQRLEDAAADLGILEDV